MAGCAGRLGRLGQLMDGRGVALLNSSADLVALSNLVRAINLSKFIETARYAHVGTCTLGTPALIYPS